MAIDLRPFLHSDFLQNRQIHRSMLVDSFLQLIPLVFNGVRVRGVLSPWQNLHSVVSELFYFYFEMCLGHFQAERKSICWNLMEFMLPCILKSCLGYWKKICSTALKFHHHMLHSGDELVVIFYLSQPWFVQLNIFFHTSLLYPKVFPTVMDDY